MIRPYFNKHKKCAFKKDAFSAPGIYIIFNNKREIVYVGRSSVSVYKAAYRHFAKWCRGKRVLGKYSDRFYDRQKHYLYMFKSNNPVQVEAALCKMLSPRDNRYLVHK